MSKGQIITPAQAGGHYAPEDLEHAAESARRMVASSPVLQMALTAMIASRQLYMLARNVMDNEIIHGFESVEDPKLVIQTLVMSAQSKSTERIDIQKLHTEVINSLLPFIDIVLEQTTADAAEQQQQQENNDSPQPAANEPECEGVTGENCDHPDRTGEAAG